MSYKWIDCSNHNPLDQVSIDDAKQQGVTGVVFNLLDNYPVAGGLLSQIDLAIFNGMRIAGYIYLNFPGGRYYREGYEGWEQVQDQLQRVREYPLEWVALDCEDPQNNLSPSATVAFIEASESSCKAAQRVCRVYTGYYWWVANTATEGAYRGSTQFSHLPLWNATNDKVPDLNYAGYGGWEYPTMEQYDFNGMIGCQEYDFNVVKEDDLRTLPLDFQETAALFRGIAANIPAIFTDDGGTAELVVEGYTSHPERDTYIIQIPKGTGRGQ